MKPILLATLLATIPLVLLPPPTGAAGNLDADVFGNYFGTMNVTGKVRYFGLATIRFAPGITVTSKYRIGGAPVYETYRFLPSGIYVGSSKYRGRRLTRSSGTWTSTARTMSYTGISRAKGHRPARVTARAVFGVIDVEIVSRSRGVVVRTDAVK